MLHVFARITPKPEYFADALAAIEEIMVDTRRESGCARFELFTSPAKDMLFLVESWADEAALEAHYMQSYTKAVFAAYADWLAEPPDVQKMQKVA